jgi:hypothetical protein
MGPFFGFPPLKSVATLHKVIRVRAFQLISLFRPIYHDADRFLHLILCFNGCLQLFSHSRLPLSCAHKFVTVQPLLSYHFTTAFKQFSYDSIQLRYLPKRATLGKTLDILL